MHYNLASDSLFYWPVNPKSNVLGDLLSDDSQNIVKRGHTRDIKRNSTSKTETAYSQEHRYFS